MSAAEDLGAARCKCNASEESVFMVQFLDDGKRLYWLKCDRCSFEGPSALSRLEAIERWGKVSAK